jgi:hypothetical protein
LRTIAWNLARMAQFSLELEPFKVQRHERSRRWLEEIAVTIVSAPTNLSDDIIAAPQVR